MDYIHGNKSLIICSQMLKEKGHVKGNKGDFRVVGCFALIPDESFYPFYT